MNVDPAATDDPDSLTWIYRQNYVDIAQIQDEFNKKEEGYLPENLKGISDAEGYSYPLYWWERIKDLIDSPDGGMRFGSRIMGPSSGNAPNQTIMRVWYCKPNRYFPRGRTLITAGDSLIWHGDSLAYYPEYKWRWHPMSISRFWRIPGRFWGHSLVGALLPMQKRINAIDSLVQLNREYMSIGQWIVPRQAKVADGALSGVPGHRVNYTGTAHGKPEKIDHQPLPAELIGERELMQRQIETLSGTQQMYEMMGKSNIRAGVMLQFLQKQMMKSRSAMLQDYEVFLETIGQNILIEVSKNVTEQNSQLTSRIAAAARDHSNLSVRHFLGSDLRDNVRIKLDIASALQKSPEAKQERAVQLVQFLADRLDDAQLGLIFQELDLDDLATQISPDFERATRMVSQITQGDFSVVSPMRGIDRSDIFMNVIKREMQSGRFDEYDDQIKQVLVFLYDEYASMEAEDKENQLRSQVRATYLLKRAEAGETAEDPLMKERTALEKQKIRADQVATRNKMRLEAQAGEMTAGA
jgi:hypothetical protein